MSKAVAFAGAVIAVCVGIQPLHAEPASGAPTNSGKPIDGTVKKISAKGEDCTVVSPDKEPAKNYLYCQQSANALKGLHFGTGILYSSSLGGVGPVNVVNDGTRNIVRVTKENDSAARAAFEVHYFVQMRDLQIGKSNTVQWALGPFVSLNTRPLDDLSGKQLFTSIGAGLMLGLNAYDEGDNSTKHSFNIGLGLLVDTDVRTLASGISDGQTTTLGVGNSVGSLTKSVTKTGFMGLMSYTFSLN